MQNSNSFKLSREVRAMVQHSCEKGLLISSQNLRTIDQHDNFVYLTYKLDGFHNMIAISETKST